MEINFTDEMIKESKTQTIKRMPDLRPWFSNVNMTKEQGHQIGFLGEFAACTYFGFDWRSNIRSDYKTIDPFDFMLRNAKVDVKTESVSTTIYNKLKHQQFNKSNRPYYNHPSIQDDKPYGRRLINSGQRNELAKKHVVLFGAINRDKVIKDGIYLKQLDCWLPLGYITVNNAMKYDVIDKKPYEVKKGANQNYPTSVMAIRSSHLLSIENLKHRYESAISK